MGSRFERLQFFCKSIGSCAINMVYCRSCKSGTSTAFNIMLQCHCRCGMSCGFLRGFNIFRAVIYIGQNCCPKADRCNPFIKVCIPLYPFTHSLYLLITVWVFPAENKIGIFSTNQINSGNLGKSYKYGQSVTSIILERVKTTAVLAGLSLIFSLGLGLFLGLFFAISRKNRYLKPLFYIDQIFISIPSFCTALLLILFFTVLLRLLPSIGVSGFSSFILPALSLSLGSSAILARYIKTSVDDEYKKDYVRTARSKGLTETQIIYRHILRNAIIPSITTLGLIATYIFGGSIIVENVFSLPGIGKLIVTSISSRDFPLLQGLTLYLAAITLFCNFAVDILYSVVDPRTRN